MSEEKTTCPIMYDEERIALHEKWDKLWDRVEAAFPELSDKNKFYVVTEIMNRLNGC